MRRSAHGVEELAHQIAHRFVQVVSPHQEEEGVWINQDAKFYLGNLKKGFQTDYSVSQKGNGVYAFVVEGDVSINGQKLNKRDGFGIWDIDKFSVTADSDSELLLMDVPMID